MTDNANGDNVVAESKHEGGTRVLCGAGTRDFGVLGGAVARCTRPEGHPGEHMMMHPAWGHLRWGSKRVPASEGTVEWVDEDPPTYIVPER